MAISFVDKNVVNQTFVTGWTINKPTGTADGDVMIATLVYGGTSTTCSALIATCLYQGGNVPKWASFDVRKFWPILQRRDWK